MFRAKSLYLEDYIGRIRLLTWRSLSAACACWLAVTLVPVVLQAQTYTDLHDFNCTVEGCQPSYPEVMTQGRDGNLYGTLRNGGTTGWGTVFKMTPSGTMTTLYNFSGGIDGQSPDGGLVLGLDGNFYGTTSAGGTSNLGTIFKITPAGALTTLHSFTGADGSTPRGGVVLGKNGSFYGTTCGFNPPWAGFSITSSGKFKQLSAVPPCPFASLILGADGNLYGTSQVGGTTYQGTVFRMSAAGAVKILYSFDYAHGLYLYSPVAQGNDGFLYGTTSGGGPTQAGVVFKLSTTGKLTLLHAFDTLTEGTTPDAGLVAANDGKFYGATSGGANYGSVPNGTLFQITSAGTYATQNVFDFNHGANQVATSMQHTNGKIYGLTQGGGAHQGGVFYSLDVGLSPFVLLMTRWGSAGQTVQILGNGLTGTSAVNFGADSASFTVVSDAYITAVVPANGVTGTVTVTTPSGPLTSSRKFNVVPVVSSFIPASGPVGAQVTIAGSGFTGATQVKFGTVIATSYTANSGTSITATVPAGAVTGKISVKTAGGSASSKTSFTVQ